MFEPDANKTNLSATSRFVVFWKEAVPNTVKLLDTVKLFVIVTSFGNPTVIERLAPNAAAAPPVTSTSLVVPRTVNVTLP